MVLNTAYNTPRSIENTPPVSTDPDTKVSTDPDTTVATAAAMRSRYHNNRDGGATGHHAVSHLQTGDHLVAGLIQEVHKADGGAVTGLELLLVHAGDDAKADVLHTVRGLGPARQLRALEHQLSRWSYTTTRTATHRQYDDTPLQAPKRGTGTYVEVQALARVDDVDQPVVLLLQQTEADGGEVSGVVADSTVTLAHLHRGTRRNDDSVTQQQQHSDSHAKQHGVVAAHFRTMSGGLPLSLSVGLVHMTDAPSESVSRPFDSSSEITDASMVL